MALVESHEAAQQEPGRTGPVVFQAVDARSREAVEAMTSYFDELAERFPEGFDPGDTLVADAGTFDPPHGVFLLMRTELLNADAGAVIGCGGVHHLEDGCAEIKRMWVDSSHRGMGLGRKLLTSLESAAGELGYTTIRLDTNSVLTEAIAMYESHGYRAIERYNDNPFAKCWFEKQIDPSG